ncbi:MAG: zf-HC2 domain-containing protein [Moorella sp. (in: Bacteria)]|nr:zf-HC2 domain-containing protein [Moorella sp. (in: firmicutes)]
MNCREARQLFSPWLDGELTDEERRAFDEHLAACRTCAVELEKLQAVAAAMRKMRVPVAPPEGFAALVAERLRRELTATVPAGAGVGSGAEATRPAGAETAGGAKVVPLAGRVKSGRKGQEAAGRGAGLEAVAAAGPEAGPERAAGRTRRFRQEDAGTGRAGAAGKAAVPGGAAGAAGGKAAATGAGQAVAVAGSGGKAGKAAGVVPVFARWQQGLRTGWRKSAAVAAVLLMLLSGSAALAARYIGLGGPGFFNLPAVAENVPSSPAGAGKDMNVDRVNPDNLSGPDSRGGQETAPPDKAGAEPGAAGASPGGGEEKQPTAPGSGRTNGERQLVAGNSPGAPGPSGQSAGKSAGEAGASGSSGAREVTAAGGGPGGVSVTGQPKVFLNQPRAIESMQIKVRVRDLDAAASQLMTVAQAKGINYSVDHKVWTAEGKVIDIFRLPVPREQVEQFIGYVSALGQVIERSPRQVRDASNEFTELLNSYQHLLEERKTASGARAQKLDAEIKQAEVKLEALDREAREQVVLIVWLEQ